MDFTRLVTDSEQLCQAQQTSIAILLFGPVTGCARLCEAAASAYVRCKLAEASYGRAQGSTFARLVQAEAEPRHKDTSWQLWLGSCQHAFCDCTASTPKGCVRRLVRVLLDSRRIRVFPCSTVDTSHFFFSLHPTTNSFACSGQIKSHGVGFRPVGLCPNRFIHQVLSS